MPTTTFSTLFITFIFTILFSIHTYAVDINKNETSKAGDVYKSSNTTLYKEPKGIILSDVPIKVLSLGAGEMKEGGYVPHVVKMSGKASTSRAYVYRNVAITATEGRGEDYIATPRFEEDTITFNSADSTIIVPAGIDEFVMYIETTKDEKVEKDETYTITLDGVSNTGTVINVNP